MRRYSPHRISAARKLPPGARDFQEWKKVFEVTAALEGRGDGDDPVGAAGWWTCPLRTIKHEKDGKPKYWRHPGREIWFTFYRYRRMPSVQLDDLTGPPDALIQLTIREKDILWVKEK
jgi:hypothetical protein